MGILTSFYVRPNFMTLGIFSGWTLLMMEEMGIHMLGYVTMPPGVVLR
jgi:hypothetical protein